MPPPPRVADLAAAWGGTQDQAVAEAVALLGKAARRLPVRVSPERWRDTVAGIGRQLLVLQVQAVRPAEEYVTAALEEQGARVLTGDGVTVPAGFADLTDGGGSWLRNLVFAPNALREQQARALGWAEAQRRALLVATSIVMTGVQDAGRAGVQTGMWTRGATYYVRVLNGASCARCAILAGRRYRWSRSFQRHPRCDCRMVPAGDEPRGWESSPRGYFRGLSTQEQDRIFTTAGAEAIRLGADINQVVNARAGITRVTAYGREVLATTSGTTRRGAFGREEIARSGAATRTAGERYRRAQAPRLMPEEIFDLAGESGWDRAEVLRQLRRFGYITS